MISVVVWDYTRLSKYNFTWWDVTSYQLYTSETAFENTAMTHASGAMALASLHNVFLSLTSNAKGIYLKLIEYQLENGKVQYYQGTYFFIVYTALLNESHLRYTTF